MFGRLRKLLLTTTALVPLGLAPAAANPLGAQVVGGSATVQGQGTATVTVNQQTNSAIINWNTFNIGAGEKTNIAMPSSSSVELDRVTGGLGPSQILGSLWSNGRVFLVNPDGILFGPGAKIDTGSFLATTHDIANSDFMAGRYNFSIPGNPTASIVNQGTITAQTGGFAALVAPGVRNSGTITATLGTVAMASGNGFTLDFYGDKLITLGLNDSIAATVKDVATGQSLGTLVKNEGTLQANGGRVELTAVAARQVVDSVINNTGVIEANSIGTKNGMIVLGATTAASKPAGAPTQTVKVSGTLSASGKKKGTTGGTVVVTGENIVVSGATIDASGVAGGGTVLIGGDTGGGTPNPAAASIRQARLQPYTVPTASTATVDAATTINASATDTGNGGKVVVWADQTTSFSGSIFARGGLSSGDGGFVETSGHQQLSFNGMVDLAAPNGTHGTLLLDPLDAIIQATAGPGVVTVSSIETALASGDVIVSTGSSGSQPGDITVDSPISWANASALTLSAYRNIAVNANISNTLSPALVTNFVDASVKLRADNTGTGTGTVSFGSGVRISAPGSVSIFYNPSVNPASSVVNSTSYVNPIENYTGNVTGGGTLTTYMLVNTVYDLQNIQNNLSANYALGKDIDASATVNWNSGAGFIPITGPVSINTGVGGFLGEFNGGGHTIDRLYINSSAQNVGLFGYVGPNSCCGYGFYYEHSSIHDLGITNADVTGNYIDSGNGYIGTVGILAGETHGATIANTYVTGSATGSAAGHSLVGGLVGWANEFSSYIYRSSANVRVISDYAGGGLVGEMDRSIIQESFATGSVNAAVGAGGLVGAAFNSAINQSYATGSVTVGPGGYAGGLAAVFDNLFGISQSYSVGAVSGGAGATLGGLVGFSQFGGTPFASYFDSQTSGQSGGAGIGLLNSDLKAGLPAGFDNTVWGINATINNGYPYLLWQTASPPPSPTILTPPALIPITITADSFFKAYGSADPLLTYHITSGSLSGSDAFSGTLTRVSGQNVGTYAINLGTLALPSAYTLTYVGATLTITPVSLTITANSISRQVGAANPTFTASYSGFVAGDGPGVVSGLSLSTPATANSPAGTYSIIAGGASALNYTISYVNGVLTVTQPPNVPPPQTQINPVSPTPPQPDLNAQLLSEIQTALVGNNTNADPTVIRDVVSALGANPSVVYQNGYIYPVGYTDDPTQCVALVHALDPTLKPGTGGTPNWTTGSWVSASNLTLRFGDAIATFNKNGSYTDTHAAIFLGYYPPNGVPKGMYILDQNTTTNGGHAEVRLRLFDTMPTLSGDGYAYATVELRNTTVTQ